MADIKHWIRVAYATKDVDALELRLAAFLHDVIEDTDISIHEIEAVFGTGVSRIVDAVTRRYDEPYMAYIDRVIDYGTDAMVVKLADLEDHLHHDRVEDIPDSLVARYVKARAKILARLEYP